MIREKVVYTIFLDAGTSAWCWMKPAADVTMYVGVLAGEYRGWYGHHAISSEIEQEITAWLLEFERSGLYMFENVSEFDWEGFNQRGLALAKKLKLEVGDKAEVRYVKPTEDPSYKREEGFEVTNQGTIRPIRRMLNSGKKSLNH